jgi:hypothetical protein
MGGFEVQAVAYLKILVFLGGDNFRRFEGRQCPHLTMSSNERIRDFLKPLATQQSATKYRTEIYLQYK